MPKVVGTIEHVAHMAHVLGDAEEHHRALVITLVDLKKAFGDVHHNLINSVLEYNNIPPQTKSSMSDLCVGFKASVMTASYSTPFTSIKRGCCKVTALVHYDVSCLYSLRQIKGRVNSMKSKFP